MLEILCIYKAASRGFSKGGSCAELMLQRTGGNDASDVSFGGQSTGIEWTMNGDQIHLGSQAQLRKIWLLRFIDFLLFSPPRLFIHGLDLPATSLLYSLWSWIEMCALPYHQVSFPPPRHTHTHTHAHTRTHAHTQAGMPTLFPEHLLKPFRNF